MSDPRRGFTFHLRSLMLIIALVALILAVLRVSPRGGILLAAVLVSGWFVTWAAVESQRTDDWHMRTLLKDTVVLSAALCVIAVCAFSLDTSAQPSKASSGTLPTVQARGIWAYPAIMCAAVVTGIMLGRRSQRSLGLSDWERLGIGLGAFCGAMIGAKLPFVLADWEGLLSGRAWFDSGKTIVFGLVGGYFGVELAKWALGIRIKTGDSFAVPVAAAVAVGRLACFVGGCCYGTVTRLPWGVDFGDGELRHPTQLYEFAFHLSAALVLHRLQQRQLLRGQLIKLYIIAYLAYRFLTEFIRPEPVLWAALTGYQLAALAFIPLFILLWIQDQRHRAA